MADPTGYKVTVKRPFVIGESPNEIVFGPPQVEGPKKGYPCYRVPLDVYNSTIPDGTPFKDLCATAEAEFARE